MNIFQIDKLHKHTEYHRKSQEPLIITAKEKTTPKLGGTESSSCTPERNTTQKNPSPIHNNSEITAVNSKSGAEGMLSPSSFNLP